MTPLPHEPAPGRARRRVDIFIALVMIVAIGTPLSYYVGVSGYDERFAWRMFSGKRAERCAVTVIETREVSGREQRFKLPLTRLIHKAWESGLKRLRPDIVEGFFDMRCEREGVRAIRMVRTCRQADGRPKPDDEVTRVCPTRLVVP